MEDLSRRLANLSPEVRARLAKELEKEFSGSPKTPDPIAVIGMGCRFPDGANNPNAFWERLKRGYDAVVETPSERWNAAEYFDPDSAVPGKVNTRWGAYLDQMDQFDAAFFGIPPAEALHMDPQQRLLLEVGWDALEDAGQTCACGTGSNTGVFVGLINHSSEYYWLQTSQINEIDTFTCTGTAHSVMANRLSYQFDFKGPSIAVDTACSSSLVAVHMAVRSLRQRECDMALAGGVHLMLTPQNVVVLSKLNMMAPDGRCKTFDSRANGFVRGEGCGLVVLKRLADAIRDQDKILAVIRGTAVNQDGRSNGLTAPNGLAHRSLIRAALKDGDIEPSQITYVETHGTGTALGDPIEVEALTDVIGQPRPSGIACFLGAVKTNIGHLEGAAGIAGLIKTVLALQHRWIPPNLHFQELNPHISLENTPFVLPQKGTAWPPTGTRRCAGVSSFGVGGTNAHLVLEEAPEEPAETRPTRPWQLLLLSAKTPEALDRATSNLAEHLEEAGKSAQPKESTLRDLADAAFTLQTSRSEFAHRRVVVCNSPSDGAAALQSRDPKRVFTHHHRLKAPQAVFMFPGQGAQYAGMGANLYRAEPVFAEEVDNCCDVLKPILKTDLRVIMFAVGGDQNQATQLLTQTRFTQPALFVIEYALAKLWMSWGIHPAAMIGHSVGEYVAGCIAGVFTLEDALSLVARRAALVQEQPSGAMLAVRLPEEQVTPLLNGHLAIAAINAPSLCVVSGPSDKIALLEQELQRQRIAARPLHTSHAFHSGMMDSVIAPFTELLSTVRFSEPKIPYVSNVTARWITKEEAKAPEYWAGHLRQTVRFADGIAELMKDSANVLLEVGPGSTLSTLARQHPAKSTEQSVLTSLPLTGDAEQRGLIETLGRLWMNGAPVDWEAFYRREQRLRVALPPYPFERKRYWPESVRTETAIAAPVAVPQPVPVSVPAPVAETASPIAEIAEVETVPRKSRLLTAVRSLLQDLSGHDLSTVEPEADLLQLGLDSLLLTQAASQFQRRFGVSITFRQLMEELNSLETIAAYLDKMLPHEAFAPAPAPRATVSVATQAVAAISNTGAVPASVLEQLLLQQQQLTNQVLQLLGRTPVSLAAPAPAPVKPVIQSLPAAPEGKSHGPFKPIQRAADMALTAEQTSALEALIARYTKRTAGSKKLTAQNRPVLADPRSVAGFKQLWKEMVYPIYTTRSDGSKVWDVDGNEYVDFVMGFGAGMFGHRPPFVVKAIHEQLDLGFEIGPIQPLAGEVAALMTELTGLQRVGFTNTGSEAVLAATRVARTVTGRDKIAVFAGAYHGIFDEVLFRPVTINGETRTAPIAPGIPDSALAEVIVLDYGNPQSIEILKARGHEIAAVLVEPVQSRRLDLQPKEFLHELRKVTTETGSALIFDEVVTGFRTHIGGAQAYFGVRADLATYGKVIGGGVSIGVVAGSPKFMDALDGGQWRYGDASFPEVGVTFFAGTFVRHPLALAAAKAVLTHIKEAGPELQRGLTERTVQLANQLRALIEEFQAPFQIAQFSSLIQLTPAHDQKFATLLYYLLRENGIHIYDNRAIVITTAHTDDDLKRFVDAFHKSLLEMRASEFMPSGLASTQKQAQPANAISKSSSASGTFPLTEAQKEIWLAAHMSTAAAVAYNESLKLEFRGEFSIEKFQAAAREVVKRHPILLASISHDGQSQTVPPGGDLDVPLIDVRGQNETERQQALREAIDREISEPFDLSTGPLVRGRIVRLAEDHHVVIWTAHHIVCDGWSGGLIISELAAIYSALSQGIQPVLETPVPFRDYAFAAATESQASIEYWTKEFAELPPPLDFPTDHPRPQLRSGNASTLNHFIDAATYFSLKRLAGQQRTTLVVLLMASFETLLYRLTGQTDLVAGLGVAGQVMTDKNCLVGHCLNMLPVRTRLQPEESFKANLAAVKKNVLNSYDHYQCTIGSLLQHISVPRIAGRSPLVEVVFNLDSDSGTEKFYGTQFSCERNAKKALHFDLFLNVVETSSGLRIECDYNSDLFERETVDRWMRNYQTLLEGVLANIDQPLHAVPFLTEEERRDLIQLRNQTSKPFPAERLYQLFESVAQRTPDATAASFENTHLSYSELNRRANQLAHHLKGLGVGPDVLVGLSVERSLDMLIALLGIMKAGGAYVPLDPSFPRDRLAYMVEDSAMRVLVTHRDLDKTLTNAPNVVVRLDADAEILKTYSTENPARSEGNTRNLAYVLYTSGSTGKPKGVQIPHSAVVNFLASMQREPGFSQNESLLAVTTLSFDIAGLELYLPLVSGGRVVIASSEENHDPVRLMERMRQSECTVMQATPATWRALLEAQWSGSPNLKILCGGEALPPDLAEQLLLRCRELWNMYGPTETTIWSMVHRITSSERSVPVGHPIDNTQVFVLDAYRNLVPDRAIGELCIGGAGLARGYFNRAELTEERFIPSPFEEGTRLYRTGDLARWTPEKTLECLGRIDTQVKVRGFRIELGEIEAILGRHETIKQCAVAVREDSDGDKRIVAFVEPQGTSRLVLSDLRNYLGKQLPDYMVPSAFVVIDRLPLTPNGKIDRKALPKGTEQLAETPAEIVAPRDAIETMLAQLWAKILKVKQVGLRDNFFELGGHSLAAVRLLAKVQELTGKTLPLATLFQASTVEALADILRRDGWTPSWSSLVPIKPSGSRTPLFLVHGAEGNVLLYRQTAQYLEADQPVYGLQSQGLNGDAHLDTTIEEMASKYVKEIVTVQPSGPYFLAGYCLGGTIAYEMAQQLAAAGETVAQVILLDTYNDGMVPRSKVAFLTPLHLLQNAWFHMANLVSVQTNERGKFWREKADIAAGRLGIRVRAAYHALRRWGHSKEKHIYPHLIVKKTNDLAVVRYVPRPYGGRVALIRSKGYFAGLTNPTFGWSDYVRGNLEVHELPIYPKGMLINPFCRMLANRLTACLRRA